VQRVRQLTCAYRVVQTLFATAQKKYVYIYDHTGAEVHCMKRHERPYRLEYLPFHMLLVSVGHSGVVKWHDISTGEYVAGYPTQHGPCYVLRQNPHNAVVHCGHSNGVVSLWSPAQGKALVTMLTHRSPVVDIVIDREGRYMCTGGLDSKLAVWDLRMFKCLHTYRLSHPMTSMDVSDRGLLAIGIGRCDCHDSD
jgi:U3 small nucleolar RNA-associated protein 7